MDKTTLHPALAGWRAVVRNWRPFVFIQVFAFVVAATYYNVPSFAAFCEQAGPAKANGGLLFSGLTTVAASTIVPEVARWITRVKSPLTASGLAFQIFFFFLAGCIIDVFYQFLGQILGTGATWNLVIEKVLVDQFVFSPLVSIPLSTIAFLWIDSGFGYKATGRAVKAGEFRRRYPAVLVTCWGFWLPTLAAVFAMPARLQFTLFLLAQGAWSLLLVYVNTETTDAN